VSETVLDAVVSCLRKSLEYNSEVQEEPVALLWPDEGGQWESVIDRIGEHLPIVSLGDFDPSSRRGPAYWIRCVVAGTVAVELPEGKPIVYLPGVGRSAMRAADDCPSSLAPIAELQYRSQWFSHRNNRDWTVRALLTNPEHGLGLGLADDAEKEALTLALDQLIDQRIDRLEKQVLDADYLHELVNQDPVLSVLLWLDDPQDYEARTDEPRWTAFVQQCKADYGFDPTVDGELSAARKLGMHAGGWAGIWSRFAEAPDLYPGVVEKLNKARPEEFIVDNVDSWPQDNERAEDHLRSQLCELEALTPEGARDEVARLDAEHGGRRGTVWAKLDQAPLAFALERLTVLGELTKQPLASGDLIAIVTDYVERGWRADDAMIRALDAAPSGADRKAVSVAVSSMYRQWLDSGSKALQSAIGPMANAQTYEAGPTVSRDPGSVILFVDGLRLDISRRVQERLTDAGLNVVFATGLAALPTVTQTAKPALVPVPAGALGPGPDLYSARAEAGTKASIQVLRSLMADNDVQVLGPAEMGDPMGAAWAEVGEIDRRGHDDGIEIVDGLDGEVSRIVSRLRELLEAGWEKVEVVTDHGWVLLPGGMEKVELPPTTTEVKKGRCARLKPGAAVDVPTVPWFWDPAVRIALAPGASCFETNKEYEHGGVSPQECIVPRLTVKPGVEAPTGGPEFTKVKWLRLQCRIEFSGVSNGVEVDLRRLPADPGSSIAERAKETSRTGKVSLVVPDEELEGEQVFLVLVALDGKILAQRELVVGRNR
jgi:hypothetical protein